MQKPEAKKIFIVGILLTGLSIILCSCRVSAPVGGTKSAINQNYKCKPGVTMQNPWVVEWDSGVKNRLSVARKQGVLLVKQTGCTLEVLYGCAIKNTQYATELTTPTSSQEEIASADDLYAKLPFGASRLQAEFNQDETWILDYVLVAEQTASINTVEYKTLNGKCAQATHFIHGMAIGAFALGSSKKQDATADAKIRDAGAGGSSHGKSKIVREAGDLDFCRNDQNDVTNKKCQAIVQLHLEPINGSPNSTGDSLQQMSSSPTAETYRPGLKVGGLISMGIGVAGGIVAGIFTAKGFAHEEDGKTYYRTLENTSDPNEYASAMTEFEDIRNNEIPRDRKMSIVGYSAAGIFLTTGLIMMLADHRKKETFVFKTQQYGLQLGAGGLEVRF